MNVLFSIHKIGKYKEFIQQCVSRAGKRDIYFFAKFRDIYGETLEEKLKSIYGLNVVLAHNFVTGQYPHYPSDKDNPCIVLFNTDEDIKAVIDYMNIYVSKKETDYIYHSYLY